MKPVQHVSQHAFLFNHLCVIGLGLIGSSLAQAVRDGNLAQRITAVDMNEYELQAAITAGTIDSGSTDVATGVAGADIIVLAVPTQAVQAVLGQIQRAMNAGTLKPDVLISDVASTKQNVLSAALKALNGKYGVRYFVPAHPIAGAEKSGFAARNASLFIHHKLIVCPHDTIDSHALAKVSTLWQAVGADVVQMDARRHDEVLAFTSHLPHLLAFNLTYQLAKHDDNLDIFRYAAGGFRDFSRIAASHPVMWHDIFLANKSAVLHALDEYTDFLANFRTLIEQENSTELKKLLITAQNARKHFGYMLLHNNSSKDIAMQRYRISPNTSINGVIKVAPDKSISHRSIMFGSLADGVTHVENFLEGEDALSTLQAFVDMGVTIERSGDKVTIHGVGIDGLQSPKDVLNMGNSGTSMRLLSGILAAQNFDSVVTGDVSLSKRPMERVAAPLRLMGANIQSTGEKGTAPLSIKGGTLTGIEYVLPVASAQIKSCLLLAGLWANGTTTITEPEVSRDHTERMLSAFGYPVAVNGNQISVTGGGRLTACNIVVPNDISSAAFFMVAASIAKDSEITLTGVGINPTRTGVIDILQLMGADITLMNERTVGGEPVADIVVKSAELHGIDIPERLVPLAIDEFPVLFVAASCATGQTKLTGAKELRVKESDRIAVMADGLASFGIDCTVLDDGIVIQGKGQAGVHTAVFSGGEINSHHDHRIAMSFAVASLRSAGEIIIHGTETVNTSFPNFATLMSNAGVSIAVED
ncbi:MAG: bifunctional prephenate dehydrogenase/3-phosphoshikimate 1-carboxyvinyltransferase [Moraxella sp.]|nr:bifunctional prephenate dehydrogenase/3-phosphoshikimate 1-carboxyvinyltransferase [Moraxella sp.]